MFRTILLPAIAASVLLTSPVFAQTAAPDAPPAAAAAPHGGERGGNRLGQRLQRLHERLGITPAQQPQWDAMVETMRRDGAAIRASAPVQALRSDQVTGVARLRAAADLARERADAMQRLVPTVEALYAVLTPSQQQIADQAIDRVLHGHRHG